MPSIRAVLDALKSHLGMSGGPGTIPSTAQPREEALENAVGAVADPFNGLTEYELRHLTVHLEAAGRANDVHHLLALEASEQHNAWYEVKDLSQDLAGYVSDVKRAWRLAEETARPGDEPQGLPMGLQCRYALALASLNSQAANVPPRLVQLLLENQVWSWEQAWARSRQMTNPSLQVQSLALIVDYAPQNLKSDLLDSALQTSTDINNPQEQVPALATLIPRLPDQKQQATMQAALRAVKEIEDAEDQASALSLLAPHLKGQMLDSAYTFARSIEPPFYRMRALAGLLPYLPDKQRAKTLPEVVQALADELDSHPEMWARQIVALAPWLTPAERQAAWQTAQSISPIYLSAKILALYGLASYVTDPLRDQVLTAAQAEVRKAWTKVKPGVVDTVEKRHAQELLSGAASYCSEDLVNDGLKVARKVFFGEELVEALLGLAPCVADDQRQAILREALIAAQPIGDEQAQAIAQTRLARHLPTPLVPQVFKTLGDIWDAAIEVQTLAELAGWLPSTLIEDGLNLAERIPFEGERTRAMAAFLPRLPAATQTKVVRAIMKAAKGKWHAARIEREAQRLQMLAAVLSYLPPDQQPSVLAKATRLAYQYLRNQRIYLHTRMNLIVDLLPALPTDQRQAMLREALAMTRAIERDVDQAEALEIIALPLATAIPIEAIAMAQSFEDQWLRTQVLTSLAQHLPLEQSTAMLEAVQSLDHVEYRVVLLASMAAALTSDQLSQTLAASYEIEDVLLRARALVRLAPHISADDRNRVLGAACDALAQIDDEDLRTTLMKECAAPLSQLPITNLEEVWKAALRRLASRARSGLLADLGALEPVIYRLGGEAAVVEAFRAVQDVGRWWP